MKNRAMILVRMAAVLCAAVACSVRPLPDISVPEPTVGLPEAVGETMPPSRRLFDRVFILSGGLDTTELGQQLEQELARQLAPTKMAQSRALLEKYLQYKARMISIQTAIDGEQDVASLRTQLQTLRDLRYAIFNRSEIDACFPPTAPMNRSCLRALKSI
ncbi:lipase secretion chaperone [Noviherbaspirillum saxi]|uniref:Lipase helper protein n=1 Tax=Noviherbaspirillum saxi TaxID=2320863 RepID=A0A3A3FF24_9BURK|nr:lipase secretion chaperone [Noviherbaspirillum saxi]RJF91936.1 hypothetical protein D3871_25025 [Noviherbaspirillum saxi]